MKFKIKIAVYILIVAVCCGSCDSFKDEEYNNYKEEPKNIDGSWQLKTVSRNGVDITNMMDFSRFRLNLNEDGTYTIDNYLPFAVKNNGQWSVDDPQYPFNLILRENNADNDVIVGLSYPIVDGKRIVSISLSPGCYRNSYQYVFEKIEHN